MTSTEASSLWRGLRLVVVFGLLISLSILTAATATTNQPQQGNSAAAFNEKGLELYRLGKFEEAIASFKQALKLKNDDPEVYYNLGNAYAGFQDLKKATEAYKQALKHRPNWATLYVEIAKIHCQLGDYKKAIESYKEAIRLNPREPAPYYSLAAAYLETGNQKAALEQHAVLKTLDHGLADKLSSLIRKPLATVHDAGITTLRVTVLDAHGAPVRTLNEQDFQVSEDRIAQTISSFSKDQVPLVYALAIDSSGSMRGMFDLVIDAGKFLIRSNLPDDQTSLIRFVSSSQIETVQNFTSNQNALNDGLDTIYIEEGQSAILDALYVSAQAVGKYDSPNTKLSRAVVLLTDGDERASYYGLEDVLRFLRKLDVRVFAVSLYETDRKDAKLNDNQPQRFVDLLRRLANETGGQAFFPRSDAELLATMKDVMNLIRGEYVIGFKPSAPTAGGTYRRIDVSIAPKPEREWKILTRPGYITPEK